MCKGHPGGWPPFAGMSDYGAPPRQLVFPQLFLFSTRKGGSTLGPFSRLLSRLPHTDMRTLPLCLALLLGQLQPASILINHQQLPVQERGGEATLPGTGLGGHGPALRFLPDHVRPLSFSLPFWATSSRSVMLSTSRHGRKQVS